MTFEEAAAVPFGSGRRCISSGNQHQVEAGARLRASGSVGVLPFIRHFGARHRVAFWATWSSLRARR